MTDPGDGIAPTARVLTHINSSIGNGSPAPKLPILPDLPGWQNHTSCSLELTWEMPALVEVCIPEKDLAPQIQRLADPTGSQVEACQNNDA